jgi:hypothetical protein
VIAQCSLKGSVEVEAGVDMGSSERMIINGYVQQCGEAPEVAVVG